MNLNSNFFLEVTYIDEKRRRVSSESAYLTKDVLQRKNLVVATHVQVTRILFNSADGETRAVGVEFANLETGPRYHAFSCKEVVIWLAHLISILYVFIDIACRHLQRGSGSVAPSTLSIAMFNVFLRSVFDPYRS